MGPRYSVVIIGTGYVGLTSGACLASLGHDVVCVDVDEVKIHQLNRGLLPIFEPKLKELVEENVLEGRLRFSNNFEKPLKNANFVFLCLPTPLGPDGKANLGALEDVCVQIRDLLDPTTVLVNKSTAPVNTVKLLQTLIGNTNPVANNPEFLREGSAVDDFLRPDRIVIGCDDSEIGQFVASIYKTLDCPIILTDPSTAEAIKYFANAFLALKISFINEAAEFCHAVGADVIELSRSLALDHRIGGFFLDPGPGWGGSCFPKDLKALSSTSAEVGVSLETVKAALVSNLNHLQTLVALIRSSIENDHTEGRKISFLGLAFKANTDDTRDSPAVMVIRELSLGPEEFVVYDPLASHLDEFQLQRVRSMGEAITDATLVIILTEWEEFAGIDPAWARSAMKGNRIIDSRYILDKERFRECGIEVMTIG